jgi:hypothetical protein
MSSTWLAVNSPTGAVAVGIVVCDSGVGVTAGGTGLDVGVAGTDVNVAAGASDTEAGGETPHPTGTNRTTSVIVVKNFFILSSCKDWKFII